MNVEKIVKKSQKLACSECSKSFLVIVHELAFYEKKGLPVPSKCFDCRGKRRKGLRNERRLYDRTCDKCNAAIKSTYEADSQYTVYCQDCYFGHVN